MDAPDGTKIGTLTAMDEDDYTNISFELVDNSSLALFRIEHNVYKNGNRSLNNSETYSITVLARDNGTPPLEVCSKNFFLISNCVDDNSTDIIIMFKKTYVSERICVS